MNRYRALVIADDMTGAADTGDRFANRGYSTTVMVGSDKPPQGTEVLVVNTDSRGAAGDVAARRVQRAIQAYSASVIYKKIDSTLRGNVAPELAAAIDAVEADLAIVAPAFPSQGRITVGGYQLVHGTPATDQETSNRSTAPGTADVRAVMADTGYRVAHLAIESVEAGRDAVLEELVSARGSTPGIVVCDATDPIHLDRIAATAREIESRILYVGSAGFAGAVRLGHADRSILGIVGSPASQTREGIAGLRDVEVIDLDGPAIITDTDAAIDAPVSSALKAIGMNEIVVVTSAQSPGDVDAALAAGRAAGLRDVETRARVAMGLGTVAAAINDAHRLDGWFTTGGAVTTAVLESLGAEGVTLTGYAVESGIPVGRIVGGTAAGAPIVTKAGGFGTRATMMNCLNHLRGYHA